MQIINRFDFLIHDRRFNGSRVFQGITLLDTRGGKLAGSGIDIPEGYVNEFLDLKNNTPKQEVRFNTMNNGENLKIFANTPFLYRGVCHGFIVAQLNIETVVTGGIHSGHKPEEFPMYIEFGRQDDIITYPLQLTEITQPIFNSAELGPKRFTINQSGHRGYFEYIGMKIGIDGTPFFLGQACPAAISGYNRPILLLIIMGVMSLVISGAAFVFWRTSHRELRLRANLAEEQSLKQEITSRNQQLETEIQTRIKLEQTLKDSEAKFRKICTAAQDAIIMLDNRGK
ncbi:MAG: hypothetical protein MI863_01365, partial [Desulfobacterales bacterium]|nr:hypothetical protein [Desulfobacterales bacterium]